MIEKLDINDYRPATFIAKVNELIDKYNEFVESRVLSTEALEDADINSVVENAEPSNVNETDD